VPRGPAALFLPAVLIILGCNVSKAGPSLDELAVLVDRARPAWEDYGEDMKAALGAAPVARWSGRPVSAHIEGSRITVVFEVGLPWRDYRFGMPILIRDPLGHVHSPVSYTQGTYEFSLDGFAPGAVIAWLEIRFPPNEERRIAFDRAGNWQAD
jgi:hypothetical protein